MTRTADPRGASFTPRDNGAGFVGGVTDFLRRADAWLDARGKWAWIIAMVAGFVIFFPLGLALLAWMIWGKQMFTFSCKNRSARRDTARHAGRHPHFASSGNAAFDNYRNETLRRLEDEQDAFEAFLQRLRDARDKQEFDQFMEDRAKVVTDPANDAAVADEEARRGAY